MNLKDKRRHTHVAQLLKAMVESPPASILQALSGLLAATNATYRFKGLDQ